MPEQVGCDRVDDPPVALVRLRGDRRRADPEVLGGGDAVDGADDLAVEEEQALVATGHGRQVLLENRLPSTSVGGRLHQRARVRVVGANQPDVDAREAVNGLDHHGAVGPQKRQGAACIGRHDRVRAQLGEAEREQLLLHLPDPGRVVDDPDASADCGVEEVRRAQIARVHGRVRPEEHRADLGGDVEGAVLVLVVPDRLDVPAVIASGRARTERDPARAGDEPAGHQGEVLGLADPDRDTEVLRRGHQPDAAVDACIQPAQRVGDEQRGHAATSAISCGASAAVRQCSASRGRSDSSRASVRRRRSSSYRRSARSAATGTTR